MTGKSEFYIKLRRSGGHCCDVLRRMRSLMELCDVVFVVSGKRYPANRAWVSASSPVLHKMLSNGMKETSEREVSISEVKSETWSRMMNYIYFEPVEIQSVDDAVSLAECARRFQVESLEALMADALVSSVDKSNCCHLLVVSDRLEADRTKTKALDVLATNFLDVSLTSSFALLDIDLVEEVLRKDDLKIRSELDVLNAIIRWLVNCGHEVDQELRDEYLRSNTLAVDSCGQEKGAPLAGESINRLTKHVRLQELSLSDLKEVVKLGRKARLNELETACMSQMLAGLGKFQLTSPIPPTERRVRSRSARVFTFQHRFHDISSAMDTTASVDNVYSPWFWDPMGRDRWRLIVYFRGFSENARDMYVSLFLCKEVSESGTGTSAKKGDYENDSMGNAVHAEEIDYHMFMLNSEENQVRRFAFVENVKLNVFSSSTFGWGRSQFLSSESVRNEISKVSDSISFGATIYFR